MICQGSKIQSSFLTMTDTSQAIDDKKKVESMMLSMQLKKKGVDLPVQLCFSHKKVGFLHDAAS